MNPSTTPSEIDSLKETDQSLEEALKISQAMCKLASVHLEYRVRESLRNMPPLKKPGSVSK